MRTIKGRQEREAISATRMQMQRNDQNIVAVARHAPAREETPYRRRECIICVGGKKTRREAVHVIRRLADAFIERLNIYKAWQWLQPNVKSIHVSASLP